MMILSIIILIMALAACSKQNWYQGTQSAQTAQCMKQPTSEFNDCNQPSTENYDSYEKKREQLIRESNTE